MDKSLDELAAERRASLKKNSKPKAVKAEKRGGKITASDLKKPNGRKLVKLDVKPVRSQDSFRQKESTKSSILDRIAVPIVSGTR